MLPPPRPIVHILAPRSVGDGATLRCAHTRRDRDLDGVTILIGTQLDERRATSFGVGIDSRVPARLTPFSRSFVPISGASAAMRVASSLIEPDSLLVAWGFDAAIEWERFGFRPPEIIVEDSLPRSSTIASIEASDLLMYATLVASSHAAADSWRETGITDVRIAEPNIWLSTTARHAESDHRAAVREAMGLSTHARLVGLLADPARLADARWFAFVLGLLYAAGLEVGGLMPPGTTSARRGVRFVREHYRRWALREWDGSLFDMSLVCDTVIVPPIAIESSDHAGIVPAAGATTITAALSLGVPVVLPACGLSRDLAANRPSPPLFLTSTVAGTEYGARILDSFAQRRGNVEPCFSGPNVISDVIREAANMDPRVVVA